MDQQKKRYTAKKTSKRKTKQESAMHQVNEIMPEGEQKQQSSIPAYNENESYENEHDYIRQFKNTAVRCDPYSWAEIRERNENENKPKQKSQPFFKIDQASLPIILEKSQMNSSIKANYEINKAHEMMESANTEIKWGKRTKQTSSASSDYPTFPQPRELNSNKEQEKQMKSIQFPKIEIMSQPKNNSNMKASPYINYLETNQYRDNRSSNIFAIKGNIFENGHQDNTSIFSKPTPALEMNPQDNQSQTHNINPNLFAYEVRQRQQAGEDNYEQYNPLSIYSEQYYPQYSSDVQYLYHQQQQYNQKYNEQYQHNEQADNYPQQYSPSPQQQYNEQPKCNGYQQFNGCQHYHDGYVQFNGHKQFPLSLLLPKKYYPFQPPSSSPFLHNSMPNSNTIDQLSDEDQIYAEYNRLDQNIFAKYYNLKYQMRAPELQTTQLDAIYSISEQQRHKQQTDLALSINQWQWNQGYIQHQHYHEYQQWNQEQENRLQAQLESKLQQCQQLQTITDNMLVEFYCTNAKYIQKMEEVGKFYQLKKHIHSTILRQERTITFLEQENAALESKIQAINRGLPIGQIDYEEFMQNNNQQQIPQASWWSSGRKPLKKRKKTPSSNKKLQILKEVMNLQRETQQVIEAYKSRQNKGRCYRFDPQVSSSCSSMLKDSQSAAMTKMKYIYCLLEMAQNIIQKLNQSIK